MAAVANSQGPMMRLLDFVDEIVSGKEQAKANVFVVVVYAALAGIAMVIWHHFSSKDFSVICTLAAVAQTAAFYLLLHKMRVAKSATGLSSKTLQMYVLALGFRLSSTMVKNGYLPVDKSGDWVYQASDVASMLLLFQLLFCIHKRYKDTYQDELDTMPIYKFIPACILLGCLLHGSLNKSPFFDKMWTIGMWLDSIAMLPQLWMLTMKGGEVEALTANYVALVFVSRCMTWWFWWTGYSELAPKKGSPDEGGFNKVGMLIMTGQSLGLLISADFMYHYFAWAGNMCGHACLPGTKKASGMVLPEYDI